MFANGNAPHSEQEIQDKQDKLENLFTEFMNILGYDQENDHNIKDSPKRIAKMYMRELLVGNFSEPPNITTFPNAKQYDQMIISGPLQVKSLCSHHLVPIIGTATVGYIPDEKVIGLSKFSRIVKFFMRRPQIQEEMTEQITNYIENLLNPKGLIVVVKAQHHCMTIRGVEEPNSVMVTSSVRGAFADNLSTRKEFFDLIEK